MKKLFTILLVFISTAVFAQPKTIFKVDIRNDKGLQQFYNENIKTANNDQLIVIPIGAVGCMTYKEYQEAYKYMLSGGRNVSQVKSYNCDISQFRTGGLITESFKDSQIIKLAFKRNPVTRQVNNYYFGTDALMTLRQYNNSIN
tara:strand:- start:959 stop:1390 length:432 start_codon:yes stop_codon:yes gene_type:complete